jgi:hypothetical protein
MTRTDPGLLPAALLGLLLASPAAAAERGVYWEQTIEMEMPGMPMAMPAQTMKVCLPADQWSRPPEGKKDKNCEVKEFKRSGDHMTWKMVCTGEHAMTGDGEATRTSDTFTGRVHMVMAQGEMNMKMRGKKVGGDCDPDELRRSTEALKQKVEAQRAESETRQAEYQRGACEGSLKEMQVSAVAGQSPACQDPAKKAEFCARLRTASGYLKVMRQGEAEKATNGLVPGPKAAAAACGVELAGVKADLCARGEKGDDLEFLADQCPEQSKAIAKRECAGRSFTALAGTRYQAFCTRMWDSGQAARQDDAAKPKSTRDEAVEKGKKLLKGFGF